MTSLCIPAPDLLPVRAEALDDRLGSPSMRARLHMLSRPCGRRREGSSRRLRHDSVAPVHRKHTDTDRDNQRALRNVSGCSSPFCRWSNALN
jgi:hypothetical protein